jgi:hypothetical protein
MAEVVLTQMSGPRPLSESGQTFAIVNKPEPSAFPAIGAKAFAISSRIRTAVWPRTCA